MNEIAIKYFNENYPRLKKTQKGEGIDLRVDSVKGKNWEFGKGGKEYIEYKKGDVLLLGLGVAMELPEGYYAELIPRSSTFKHWGLIQANGTGLIDNSYSGNDDEWLVQMVALRDGCLHRFDRVCQFTVKRFEPLELVEVAELKNENRGGYGTTGKN